MSGKSSSPHGIKEQRIQAAREWLNRAEAQFASGQDVLAAATLMLAQAELKLTVEKIAGGRVTVPVEVSRKKFRLQPVGRTLIGAVALAACFLFGIYIGNFQAPNAPANFPGDDTARVIQIADAQPAIEAPSVEPFEMVPAEGTSTEMAGVEEEQPVYAPPSSQPDYHPRTTRTPSHEPQPVSVESPAPTDNLTNNTNNANIPIPETLEPVEVSYEPPAAAAGVDAVSSEGVISEAEVALATIRFLSERLLMGDKE